MKKRLSTLSRGLKRKEFLPRTKEQWLDEGHRFHKAKRYEKALAAYEHALHLDVNYARAHRNKGDALHFLMSFCNAAF